MQKNKQIKMACIGGDSRVRALGVTTTATTHPFFSQKHKTCLLKNNLIILTTILRTVFPLDFFIAAVQFFFIAVCNLATLGGSAPPKKNVKNNTLNGDYW